MLAWFAEAGTPPVRPGTARVPEPPVAAVREPLVWALQRSASQRLVEFARSVAGAGEEGQDAWYAAAAYRDGLVPAGRGPAASTGHPSPGTGQRPGHWRCAGP